jgi:hypothetical protein
MGLVAWILRPSRLTHGSPPCSFLLSLVDVVTMVPNLVSSGIVFQCHRCNEGGVILREDGRA